MNTKKSPVFQVALLTQLNLKCQVDSLRGILRYTKLHGPWRLYRMEGRSGEQKLLDLKRWGCSGIITGACNIKDARLIARVGVPVVVSEPTPEMRESSHPLFKYSCTQFNSYSAGKMAARYFLDRHYTRFAFVGEPHGLYWSLERGKGFKETVEQAGGECFMYCKLTYDEQHDWAVEQPRMRRWLKSLPKPIALFAAMDGRGSQILDACMAENISVPDEIAVLGVDNDELICEATFPTMSSMQTTGERNGFLIAEHLDQLMRGKRLKKRIFEGGASHVITRRSTDATMIPDAQIARALEFIWREGGHQPIHVPDVVEKIGSSRRHAEMRFKTITGRTILEEILRVRLERVCTLLCDTNLSISEITYKCGFERESYLARLFKLRFDCTMSTYRSRMNNRM